MIRNSDIRSCVEAAGLRYCFVTNAAELETVVHSQVPEDGTDLVVSFVDTSGSCRHDRFSGRTFETRNALFIFYSRVDFERSRDAMEEGDDQEARTATHKDSALAFIAALNASGKFQPVTDWAYTVHPFETTDVLNGLWVTFKLVDAIGDC